MTDDAPGSGRKPRSATQVTEPEHEQRKLDQRQVEPQKNYHTILEQQIQQAREDLERPAKGLLLSGFTAGLDLGLGPFLMCVVLTLVRDELSHAATEFLLASAYSVGFVFVVFGRSALFTEQTTSAVMPVLARRVPARRLFRLWGLVLVANIAGAFIFAALASYLGPRLGAIDIAAMQQIANRLLSHDAWTMFWSAVGAGWLMGLLSWLVVAARDTVSQIVIVWMTTFLIGIAGLHHSIAGSVEILMAVFALHGGQFAEYLRFLALAVVGNAIGGSVFVALLKYGHISASSEG